MKVLRNVLLITLANSLIPVGVLAQSQTKSGPNAATYNSELQIGPVPGLTTDWHPAPTHTAVPLGVTIQFKVPSRGARSVEWYGARAITAHGGATAECRLSIAGPHTVTMAYTLRNGERVQESSHLNVIDTSLSPIKLSNPRLWANSVFLAEDTTNDTTMRYYFGDSIADVRQTGNRRFLTSTNRWFHLGVDIEPAEFAPLVEWRLNGEAQQHLGTAIQMQVFPPREHVIEMGPIDGSLDVFLETYLVRITSHSTRDEVPDWTPVTFKAVTIPEGYESEITWLASTKYGACDPVQGKGPEFTVSFRSTSDVDGRWIGVKAGNAVFGKDNKEPPRMPVYRVTQTGLTVDQARDLASALAISAEVLGENGAASHTSDNFLFVPVTDLGQTTEQNEDGEATVAEALDLDGLEAIEVLESDQAIFRIEEALARANLPISLWGPMTASSFAGHAVLEAVDTAGVPMVNPDGVRLDTHVHQTLTLEGVPYSGPGAKIKMALGGDSQVTHLTYAMRALERAGEVPIITPSDASELCMNAFSEMGLDMDVSPELMYYAPSLDIETVAMIYPHYACNGTAQLENEAALIRTILIPAPVDTIEVELTVAVQTSPAGTIIMAGAEVTGGRGPYTFMWDSGSTLLDIPDAPTVSYELPLGGAGKSLETVTVLVQDADGLQGSAAESVDLGSVASVGSATPQPPFKVAGIRDVGIEWIGTCQGLAGSARNASGFATSFQNAAWDVVFEWGNQNAWERDFIDRAVRANGIDDSYVDNADFVFYTGHANGDGFTFCSNQSDGFLHFNERPRWGDSVDLEWLTIASCGPLQAESSGQRWWQRWGPAFEGLHLLLAYQTVSYDNTTEGMKLASKVLQGKTVRQAWIETAIEVQPPSVRWAVMGVIGPSGAVNLNDHVWGRGSVGPDVRGGDKRGYWMISGPS